LSDCVQQGILAVQQEWLEHELNGNIAGVVSLCSDDVVWLPPNQPALRGQNAVAGWLAALPEHRIRRIEIINVRIYSSGDLAYKLADFTTWFEKAGQTSDEFVTGSHLWVLRESSPGHWQVAVVAWSTAGPTNTA
jgi:ketosteroid isomerase-like protein